MKAISIILRLSAAIIMLQTLFYKFSAHPDSVYIFTQTGMEPWGRYLIGSLELIAAILILIPRTSWLGAGLGAGLMFGALFFHIVKLGFEVHNDGGLLCVLAIITLIGCLGELFLRRDKIFSLIGLK